MCIFFFFLLLLTSFLQAQQTIVGPQPDWNEQLDFDAIEHQLLNEPIIEKMGMRQFLIKSNKEIKALCQDVLLVVLKNGLKAVLKKANACYGEVIAYKAAKKLDLRLIPPTVLRKINGETVSLQFYVATDIDAVKQDKEIMKKISQKDLCDKATFEYVFNKWDIHSGNHLITKHKGKYFLALIDNASVIQLGPEKTVTPDMATHSILFDLKKINNQKAIEDLYSDYLPIRPETTRRLIKKTLERIDFLVRYIEAYHSSKSSIQLPSALQKA